MEKILAIYDSDLFYVTRFMEYFKKKKEINFEVLGFSKRESIEEYLLFHKIEILLLGEQIEQEELPLQNIRFIYQFTEDYQQLKESNQLLVFKYQPVLAVMDYLLEDYEVRIGVSTKTNNSELPSIIAVVSLNSNYTNLSFAWSVGSQLAKKKKVLLVSLELFPIPIAVEVEQSRQPLSEFIYYLKENSNSILKMKTLVGKCGNLSYLTGVIHGYDLLSINKEDIQKWVTELKNHSEYETIIFYLDYYNEANIELIKLSDSVLLPTTGTSYENVLRQEWDRQMNRIGITTDDKKYQTILLPIEEMKSEPLRSLQELSNGAVWASALQYCSD